MGLIAIFGWRKKKQKLIQEAKEFMISESAKQPRTWHGMITEEWMADFAAKKMKEVTNKMSKETDEIAELKARLDQLDIVKARIEHWEVITRNMERDTDRNIHQTLIFVLKIFDEETK